MTKLRPPVALALLPLLWEQSLGASNPFSRAPQPCSAVPTVLTVVRILFKQVRFLKVAGVGSRAKPEPHHVRVNTCLRRHERAVRGEGSLVGHDSVHPSDFPASFSDRILLPSNL
jgi:hypothetical protein